MWDCFRREPHWFRRFSQSMEFKMAALDDELAAIAASQADTLTKVATVQTGVTALLAQLAAFPPSGLTPEQQAALDGIRDSAANIDTQVGAINTTPPPPTTT